MLGGFSVVLYSKKKKIASIKNKTMVSGQPSKILGSKRVLLQKKSRILDAFQNPRPLPLTI
jgi:hypothetical protein